jgi:hypothetical protein
MKFSRGDEGAVNAFLGEAASVPHLHPQAAAQRIATRLRHREALTSTSPNAWYRYLVLGRHDLGPSAFEDIHRVPSVHPNGFL